MCFCLTFPPHLGSGSGSYLFASPSLASCCSSLQTLHTPTALYLCGGSFFSRHVWAKSHSNPKLCSWNGLKSAAAPAKSCSNITAQQVPHRSRLVPRCSTVAPSFPLRSPCSLCNKKWLVTQPAACTTSVDKCNNAKLSGISFSFLCGFDRFSTALTIKSGRDWKKCWCHMILTVPLTQNKWGSCGTVGKDRLNQRVGGLTPALSLCIWEPDNFKIDTDTSLQRSTLSLKKCPCPCVPLEVCVPQIGMDCFRPAS